MDSGDLHPLEYIPTTFLGVSSVPVVANDSKRKYTPSSAQQTQQIQQIQQIQSQTTQSQTQQTTAYSQYKQTPDVDRAAFRLGLAPLSTLTQNYTHNSGLLSVLLSFRSVLFMFHCLLLCAVSGSVFADTDLTQSQTAHTAYLSRPQTPSFSLLNTTNTHTNTRPNTSTSTSTEKRLHEMSVDELDARRKDLRSALGQVPACVCLCVCVCVKCVNACVSVYV